MTIYRKEEERILKTISLSGNVLDMGGHESSPYRKLFQGSFTITTANMLGSGEDIECDFEEPLPIPDNTYDSILLMNVLEHIFEYRQLLSECNRILKPNGKIVIATPFLLPYHASPNDFHRYTATALELALTKSGFIDVVVTTVGTGVFVARWGLLERLLPGFLQVFNGIEIASAKANDAMFSFLARSLGKKYQVSDYALAYITEAKKTVH